MDERDDLVGFLFGAVEASHEPDYILAPSRELQPARCKTVDGQSGPSAWTSC